MMSSSPSTSESPSRVHSLSSTSLSSSRSSSSFFYHGSHASSVTEISSSPPGSPNLQTSSQKTKGFIAVASARLSKACGQVSHALSDATPKDLMFRSPINPAIVEEDVGYESDGDIRGANMKVSSSSQNARPKFLRVDTKQHKRAASILHPFSVTTKAIAPNSNTTHKRSLARLDTISNTRAIPDYELATMTLSKPPAGLGLTLPSVYLSRPIPRACTMPTMKSSSGHNLKDSLPHRPPNLPPQTSHLYEPPKVHLRPIELPGTPSPMEYLPPSIMACESLSRKVNQSSSVLPSPVEGLSPLWTFPPLTGFAPLEAMPQSPLLLRQGSVGGWNPYFPSV
ncbi:uncharacterized protein F5147DRAFT_802923 [Suillus discolor]|uniref:Uncharacterized protein n=1 Tax=Suillus discolor TaxID=1912936 RepID=A0A9P7F6N3_9AGAM|nr:uncharacterized protein F5147DRAFT_802923 [Suillus discolor]KAG2107146.1 hypothetical protein F5147DRAFT_802923 [Suillus discolor]